jgi:hypothetical protein
MDLIITDLQFITRFAKNNSLSPKWLIKINKDSQPRLIRLWRKGVKDSSDRNRQ